MTDLIRLITAISAALAATNAFLLALPGDAVTQAVLIGVGSAAAGFSAMAAYFNKPDL
jgi:hypothetical protein